MKTVSTSRPRLASMLLDAGVKCKRSTNPFAEHHKYVWEFPLTGTARNVIDDYYFSIGQAVPERMKGGVCDD